MKKTKEQDAKVKLDDDIGLELIKTALRNLKRVKLSFKGKSMEPSIKNGEKVFFEGVPQDRIRIGDIVLFNNSGALIGHRVMWKARIKEIYFLTKGDNSNFPDHPIPAKKVYGRVIPSRNRSVFNKISFSSKVGFLLDIILSKIETLFSRNLKIFRVSLSRIFYASLKE